MYIYIYDMYEIKSLYAKSINTFIETEFPLH